MPEIPKAPTRAERRMRYPGKLTPIDKLGNVATLKKLAAPDKFGSRTTWVVPAAADEPRTEAILKAANDIQAQRE